ncbi:MAG: class I SAM-dependent methyltransferase [Oscillospiraceae bacterium]|jgi:SAM-dependent methyltransferase
MKENKYDNPRFFEKYSRMDRSQKGLEGAGEWHVLKKMLPEFSGKRVLDLGCGFGWHCRYALEHGAAITVGIDISERMLARAKEMTCSDKAVYRCQPVEDYAYPENAFDVVLSSLAFHYVESFEEICEKVNRTLVPGGDFIFSVEHPVFTAYGSQDWIYDQKGNILHWPVDRYFTEGRREAVFLGEPVTKYHKTLTTYLNGLLRSGFEIREVIEPMPEESMLDTVPGMREELRRPMMLLVSARKK